MTKKVWVVFGINEDNDVWCIHTYSQRPTKALMENLHQRYNVNEGRLYLIRFYEVESRVEDVS